MMRVWEEENIIPPGDDAGMETMEKMWLKETAEWQRQLWWNESWSSKETRNDGSIKSSKFEQNEIQK